MVWELVLGVVVLGLLIYRQLRARPLSGQSLRIVVILGLIGLVETWQFLQKNHPGTVTFAALAGSLLLVAVFGAARAVTIRIWLQDGQAWSQGGWLTALLWLAALAAHLGYGYLLGRRHGVSGLGNATILLYLAITLAVQRVIIQYRAQRLQRDGAPSYGPGPVSSSSKQ